MRVIKRNADPMMALMQKGQALWNPWGSDELANYEKRRPDDGYGCKKSIVEPMRIDELATSPI